MRRFMFILLLQLGCYVPSLEVKLKNPELVELRKEGATLLPPTSAPSTETLLLREYKWRWRDDEYEAQVQRLSDGAIQALCLRGCQHGPADQMIVSSNGLVLASTLTSKKLLSPEALAGPMLEFPYRYSFHHHSASNGTHQGPSAEAKLLTPWSNVEWIKESKRPTLGSAGKGPAILFLAVGLAMTGGGAAFSIVSHQSEIGPLFVAGGLTILGTGLWVDIGALHGLFGRTKEKLIYTETKR